MVHRASVGLLTALSALAGPACFNPTAGDDSSPTTTAGATSTSTSTSTTLLPTTGPSSTPTDASTADLPTTCVGDCDTTSTSDATTSETSETSTTGGRELRFIPRSPLQIPGALDLATVRLDDDTLDDLAISSMTAPDLAYVFGAAIDTVHFFPTGRSFPLLAADADGDGKRDDLLLGYDASPSSLHLLRNQGGATFDDLSTGLPAPCVRPISIDAADLNKDSHLDYVVACAETTSGVYLVPGEPVMGLAPAIPVDLGIGPTFVHLLDVFGDPEPDLVAPYLNTGKLFVFAGEGGGSFTALGALDFDLSGAAGTDLGRIDEDDLPDVAVSRLMTDQCSVLLHLAVGLAAPQSFACGPEVRDLALGDFDGDGLADLATIHLDFKLRVALNNGDGTFAAPLLYAIGSSAWRVTVGDYNGDGHLDIAASTLHEVYLFLQDA